jgi:hypothetical protein
MTKTLSEIHLTEAQRQNRRRVSHRGKKAKQKKSISQRHRGTEGYE